MKRNTDPRGNRAIRILATLLTGVMVLSVVAGPGVASSTGTDVDRVAAQGTDVPAKGSVADIADGASASAATQGPTSRFDNGTEGWTVAGDAQSVTPTHATSGGNPGGHLLARDRVVGGVWYWDAPSEFLGNRSAYLNGSLSYDLRQSSTSSQFDAVDVALQGENMTLEYKFAGGASAHPGTNWTSYEVPIAPTSEWRIKSSRNTPTTEDFESVLASLQGIRIRGEYRSGSDTGRLDNVVLSRERTVDGGDDTSGNETTGGNEPPLAAVFANDTSPSVGESVSFTAAGSTDPDGTVFTYGWDFDGDGGTDEVTTGPTVTHNYSSAGSYTATLTVTDDDGATDTATVTVDVESTGGGTEANIVADPAFPGDEDSTHRVNITVGSALNGSTLHAVRVDYSVGANPPNASAVDAVGNVGRVRVERAGSGISSPNTPENVTLSDDGQTLTVALFDGTERIYEGDVVKMAYGPVGNPSTAGTTDVEVTLNPGGNSQAETTTLTIGDDVNSPPQASVGAPENVSVGESVTFSAASSTDPDGQIVSYAWDFDGDDQVDRTTGFPRTSYTYSAGGSYTATVTVTDEDGAADTATVNVSVGSTTGTGTGTGAMDVTVDAPDSVAPGASATINVSGDPAGQVVISGDTSSWTVTDTSFTGGDPLGVQTTPNSSQLPYTAPSGDDWSRFYLEAGHNYFELAVTAPSTTGTYGFTATVKNGTQETSTDFSINVSSGASPVDGVSTDVYEAAAGADGDADDLTRDDVVRSLRSYIRSGGQSIAGANADRSEVVTLVRFYIQSQF